jgi:hypothetical protein
VTNFKSIPERLIKHSRLDENGCRIWIGCLFPNGYGSMSAHGKPGQYVHRLAWVEEHGPIPPGMFVCHQCDVRRCINVDHLFLGTYADNSRDMALKGRGTRSLTDEVVRAIRADDANGVLKGMTRTQIGERYGTTYTIVNKVRHRETYRHVV